MKAVHISKSPHIFNVPKTDSAVGYGWGVINQYFLGKSSIDVVDVEAGVPVDIVFGVVAVSTGSSVRGKAGSESTSLDAKNGFAVGTPVHNVMPLVAHAKWCACQRPETENSQR